MVKRETRDTHFLNQAGVFAGTLLVTAMAVYFYSPVIGSHADEARVTVTNEPVISLALNTNNLAFTINPSSEGTFSSDLVWALTDTNSTGGYELYFSSNDNATDMISTDQGNTSVVASDFNGTVNSSTMGANKWGYSLDNTDFLKIPTLANQVRIVDINHLPTPYELEKAVYFGIKVSNTLPAGTYAKIVKFSAIAHETPNDLFTIWDMQDMTSAICSATTTPYATATELDWDGSHRGDKNYVPRVSLNDTRDGKSYLVSKLADGNCWMSQNLALDLTKGAPIVASNNDGTTTIVVPDNSTESGNVSPDDWLPPNEEELDWRSYKPQSSGAYYRGGLTKSDSPSGQGVSYDWEKAGNFYNWYAATASTGSESMSSGDANASICPKGWRLPPVSGAKSLNNLLTVTYDLSSAINLYAAPFNFVNAGFIYYNEHNVFSVVGEEESASLFTSTSTSDNLLVYMLMTYNDEFWDNTDYYKASGSSVRCVAI